MDKRKNNGGHSTKARGADKRTNKYKKAVEEAASEGDVKEVIRMLYKQSIETKSTRAAKLFLEYTVGKPITPIEGDLKVDFPVVDMSKWK